MPEPRKIMGAGQGQTTKPKKTNPDYVAPTTRVRTNREGMRNINAGVTKAQQEALAREEARIHKTPIGKEEAVVIDRNGVVNPLGSPMVKTGTRRTSSGTATYAMIDKRKVPADSILIHNHPGFAGDTNSMATRIGYPFTTPDITTGIDTNASEIRAIAGGYTYSLKRPANGWPAGFDDAFERERKRQWNDLGSQVLGMDNRGQLSLQEFKVREERANLLSRYRALNIVSKKYGVKFTRTRHSYTK